MAMKVKFLYESVYNKDHIAKTEKTINKWLGKLPHGTEIKEIRQVINSSNSFVLVSVWYDDSKCNTR